MGTVYQFSTVKSDLLVDQADLPDNCYVHKNGFGFVYAETKNWGNHMQETFRQLSKIAVSGKMIVEEVSEDNDSPRYLWIVRPNRVTYRKQKPIEYEDEKDYESDQD